MGVTWVSEAGWGARPAEVLLEGLEVTADMTGRLLQGGALGPLGGGEQGEGHGGGEGRGIYTQGAGGLHSGGAGSRGEGTTSICYC